MTNPDTPQRAGGAGGTRRKSPGSGRPGAAGWTAAAKRAMKEFKADNLQDWAAALTYYGILSIFPGLLVLVCLLGLDSPSSTNAATLISAGVRLPRPLCARRRQAPRPTPDGAGAERGLEPGDIRWPPCMPRAWLRASRRSPQNPVRLPAGSGPVPTASNQGL